MKRNKTAESKDTFLSVREKNYDLWMKKGLISVSSKVVPVNESFEAEQWILPTEQAVEILRNAGSIAVIGCLCRSHFQRCSNPLEVCLLLNAEADKLGREGRARFISMDEAKGILTNANACGLVHLTLYRPNFDVYALCSCCSCCCHDLQLLISYGRKDLIARSEYVSQSDPGKCLNCGNCAGRCIFEARRWEGGEMRYTPETCYGCGLCVSVCPAGAIVMERKL